MAGKQAANKLGIRAYIKGRSLLGIKFKDIHSEVCNIYGNNQMSYSTVCRWATKFQSGLQQFKDAARPGRPVTSTTNKNVDKIGEILKVDARHTVRNLAHMTNLSLARVHVILKKHLKVKKINARWVPHLLSED